jgi:hypothetical protein
MNSPTGCLNVGQRFPSSAARAEGRAPARRTCSPAAAGTGLRACRGTRSPPGDGIPRLRAGRLGYAYRLHRSLERADGRRTRPAGLGCGGVMIARGRGGGDTMREHRAQRRRRARSGWLGWNEPPKRVAGAARRDEHRRHAGVHAEKRNGPARPACREADKTDVTSDSFRVTRLDRQLPGCWTEDAYSEAPSKRALDEADVSSLRVGNHSSYE